VRLECTVEELIRTIHAHPRSRRLSAKPPTRRTERRYTCRSFESFDPFGSFQAVPGVPDEHLNASNVSNAHERLERLEPLERLCLHQSSCPKWGNRLRKAPSSAGSRRSVSRIESRRAAVRDLDRQGRCRDSVAGGRRPDRYQRSGEGRTLPRPTRRRVATIGDGLRTAAHGRR
jgi:hypothetical protein